MLVKVWWYEEIYVRTWRICIEDTWWYEDACSQVHRTGGATEEEQHSFAKSAGLHKHSSKVLNYKNDKSQRKKETRCKLATLSPLQPAAAGFKGLQKFYTLDGAWPRSASIIWNWPTFGQNKLKLVPIWAPPILLIGPIFLSANHRLADTWNYRQKKKKVEQYKSANYLDLAQRRYFTQMQMQEHSFVTFILRWKYEC